MIAALRKRLKGDEQGFTLIELLVVIIILGILVAIAVPSYLSFSSRANKGAAQSQVRAVVPDIEAYYSDNGNYTGMTATALKTTYDSSIDPSKYTIKVPGNGSAPYCVDSTVNGVTWSKNGPDGALANAAC